MSIYLVNILLIIMWGMLASFTSRPTLKRWLFAIVFLQFVAIFSLRDITVGTDTPGYIVGWNLASENTLIGLITGDYIRVHGNEWGFLVLNKLISLFASDQQVYFFIMSIIIFAPLFFTVYRYSDAPFLSILLYVTLGFFNLSLTMLRQSIALSIALIAFHYLVQRKTTRFLLMGLIACLFHQSALVFLPAVFIKEFRFTSGSIVLYIAAFLFLYFYRIPFFNEITTVFNTSYGLVDTGAYALFAIIAVVFSAGLLFYKQAIEKNKTVSIYFNFISISLLLMIFNTVSNITLRLAHYYYIFVILFIPAVIHSFRGRETRLKALLYEALVFSSILIYIQVGMRSYNTSPYIFFWR